MSNETYKNKIAMEKTDMDARTIDKIIDDLVETGTMSANFFVEDSRVILSTTAKMIAHSAVVAKLAQIAEEVEKRRDNKLFEYPVIVSKKRIPTKEETEMFTDGFNTALNKVLAVLQANK